MPSAPADSDYRLASALVVRVVGGLLVALAVLLVLWTVLVAVLGGPVEVLLVVAALGLAGVLAVGYVLTRRLSVVHLGAEGYRVRLIRGVGVAAAPWKQVSEAVTTTVAGSPVVRLRLGDERTTTIPVAVLAVDREEFVRDLQAHLQHGQGRRPLT